MIRYTPLTNLGEKSDADLQSLLDYHEGIVRAAKSAEQRTRADFRAGEIETEMRMRGLRRSNAEARARAGFMS